MGRSTRLDYPDALHHVMARGNNKCIIFNDDADRVYFVKKLADILLETNTKCYAWALMPNHIHLLLKRVNSPISHVMHRLLTSYATYHNKKYERVGHLFQNRFKSILCQDDQYLLTLVKYIHLNPIKAGIIKNLNELSIYPWTGHQAMLGITHYSWQDCSEVLEIFDENQIIAREEYLKFMTLYLSDIEINEIQKGKMVKMPNGVWCRSTSITVNQIQRSNELILGSENFIKKVFLYNKKISGVVNQNNINLVFENLLSQAAFLCNCDISEVLSKFRRSDAAKARSILCAWSIDGVGMLPHDLSRKLKMSINSIYAAASRGRMLMMNDPKLKFRASYLSSEKNENNLDLEVI